MMPPECHICNKDFPPSEGGLIYFKEDEEDISFNKRFKESGFVGHPSNAFWFCEKHYLIAKKYKNYSKREALSKINEELKDNS